VLTVVVVVVSMAVCASVDGDSDGGDPFFEKSQVVQPPLAETIKLAPGVVLREGTLKVPGPPPTHSQMSKSEFMVRLSRRST
jgi:hypothetical protein